MAKEQSLATADSLESLTSQYGVAKTLLKNNGVGIALAVNESDLKTARGWMTVGAEFVVTYDGDAGIDLVVKVKSNRDKLSQINLAADPEAGRETLEKLSKRFPQLVSKAEVDKFAKKHPAK